MNLFKRAAQLRRKNKRLTVPASVKLAAKELRTGKKIGAYKVIERGENKNAKVTKTIMQKRSAGGQFRGYKKVSGMPIIAGATVGQAMGAVKKVLLHELGQLEAKKFAEKTKRGKAKIAKIIAEKKRLYKKMG